MDAILRTQGPFQIVYDSGVAFRAALQISGNLLQCYGAAANLSSISAYDQCLRAEGNVIVVVVGYGFRLPQLGSFPIRGKAGVIQIRSGQSLEYCSVEDATGAALLRSLPNQRLELVIWGPDEDRLRQAARMVPEWCRH